MIQPKVNDVAALRAVLKKHGLKATPQRIAVHEAMMKLGHASADMVAAEIEKNGSASVTTASVYNILSQMALLGVYDHRMSSNNKMYFDVNTFKHAHMYDCENHVYKDIMDDELMALVYDHVGHKKFRGYTIEDVMVQVVVRPTKKRLPRL